MAENGSLFWIARCDRCRQPATAHAMSVLREEMLCMACLVKDAADMAAYREAGRLPAFAQDPVTPGGAGLGSREVVGQSPSRMPMADGTLYVQETKP